MLTVNLIFLYPFAILDYLFSMLSDLSNGVMSILIKILSAYNFLMASSEGNHLCQQPFGDCLTATSGLSKNRGLGGPIWSLAQYVP